MTAGACTDEPEPMSLLQQRLIGVGENMMKGLEVYSEKVLLCSPDQVADLARACNETYWFMLNAHLFDKRLSDEQKRLYCD